MSASGGSTRSQTTVPSTSSGLDDSTACLVQSFEHPAATYGPIPIWWWSGEKITRERLRWQMEQLVGRACTRR